jgi:hypothetical protein
MENRNELLVQTFLTEANSRAERDAALLMVEAISQREAGDLSRGQELRNVGIRRRTPRDEHHPACGAER